MTPQNEETVLGGGISRLEAGVTVIIAPEGVGAYYATNFQLRKDRKNCEMGEGKSFTR